MLPVLIATLAALASTRPEASDARDRHCVSIAAPSYYAPGPQWDTLLSGAPLVQLAVINPDSGVGASRDEAYAAVVSAAQARAVRVVGYVHTAYGSRDLAAVQEEIRNYVDWYGVDGIFVDEAATSAEAFGYYAELDALVDHIPDFVSVLNPGVIPDPAYAAVGDIIVSFEGSLEDYRHHAPPAWARALSPSRFWHIVHGVADDQGVATVTALAAANEAQHLWVASQSGANPYAAPPHHFNVLTDTLARNYATCTFL